MMIMPGACKVSYKYGGNFSHSLSTDAPVIAFATGDVNRDYEVDFYDIVETIGIVYDTNQETLDWRVRAAANSIVEPASDRDIDFFDIIALISFVYDAG